MGGIRFTWVSQDGVWMEMGKMEQRKRGRAKYHNFQGCRRGQFLMMVFILSNPPLLSFFLTTLWNEERKKFHFFLHYFVTLFSFARDMVTGKIEPRYWKRQALVAFATCMAQERQWFALTCPGFRVAENGNSLNASCVRPYLGTWKIFLVRMPGGLALHPT